MNLSDREREAKIKSIADHLETVCHKNGPFKEEFAGIFWNYRSWAEHILKLIDETEMEFDVYYQEARLANSN